MKLIIFTFVITILQTQFSFGQIYLPNQSSSGNNNVGIGINQPSERLHIVGDNPGIRLNDVNGTLPSDKADITFSAANGFGRIISDQGFALFLDANNNDNDVDLTNSFMIMGNTNSFTVGAKQLFKVSGNGNTDIFGNLNIPKNNPSIILEDNEIEVGTTDKGTLQIVAANGSGRLISDKAVTIFLDSNNNDADSGGNNQFSIISNDTYFSPTAKVNFLVTGEGDVSVGRKLTIGNVTTPGNYSIYAERGILTEKVRVALKNSSDWADYVFSKDYKLMPLKELEAYINTNKHLPNIPAAEQVKEQGIDLTEMNIKLLEKIEELTLHLIEQQKQIDALKIENEKILKKLDGQE